MSGISDAPRARRLSTAAAWREIARCFAMSPRQRAAWYSRNPGGLCNAVGDCYGTMRIGHQQYSDMRRALRAYAPGLQVGPLDHWWPLTPKGGEQRMLCALLLAAEADDAGEPARSAA